MTKDRTLAFSRSHKGLSGARDLDTIFSPHRGASMEDGSIPKSQKPNHNSNCSDTFFIIPPLPSIFKTNKQTIDHEL